MIKIENSRNSLNSLEGDLDEEMMNNNEQHQPRGDRFSCGKGDCANKNHQKNQEAALSLRLHNSTSLMNIDFENEEKNLLQQHLDDEND